MHAHSKDGNTWVATPKYGTTKKVGNITYRLDGWYTDEACTNEFNFATMTIHTDTTFYAKYVPASANLTISKTVTGMLGDTNKAFTFTIKSADGKALTITDADIVENSADVTFNTTNNTFTLTHGDHITLSLPVGSYVVEETAVDNYTAKYKIGSDAEIEGRSATVTLSDTNQTLAFTNHCDLKPDLGVLLDTLPYIVILAVVAGGVALLMLRKRRKEDD